MSNFNVMLKLNNPSKVVRDGTLNRSDIYGELLSNI
ncbi:hypothetical protein SAMN05443246_1167 [Paenibacillus sp. GP183]|nr:hypothetical protein SAMN05443246_1167 [Paenibacillus sp. GP183]